MTNHNHLDSWIEEFSCNIGLETRFSEELSLFQDVFFCLHNSENINDIFLCIEDFFHHPIHTTVNIDDIIYY